MAVKLAADNSLLIRRDPGLWLQMLIQKQSLHSSVPGEASTRCVGLQYRSNSPILALGIV